MATTPRTPSTSSLHLQLTPSSSSSGSASLCFDDSHRAKDSPCPTSSPRRSPAPRSAAFASLSRMRFTRASVQHMVQYLVEGTPPPDWSRARAWRFRQQMGAFTWRVGTDAATSTGSTEAGTDAATTAGSTAVGTNTADATTGAAMHVLEVQVPDPSADGRASSRPAAVWLRVVAEEDTDDVLHALYIDPAQGSLRGAKALYERALTRYAGITMRAVHAFLRRQETRQAVLPKQGYLVVQPADVSDVGHWQADLTDVSLFTNTDAKHLLVCVDMFSKYAWAVPLESKHAARITAALEALWLQEGPPLTLRTDGGSDTNNGDVAALCARYGVARKVCAPYNSQCNGGVERLHRTLKETMAKHTHEWLSGEGTVDWVRLLPLVLYSYNTSVHRTTGFTPFLLQRGRAPRPLGPMQLADRVGAALAGPPLFDGATCAVAAPEPATVGTAPLPAPAPATAPAPITATATATAAAAPAPPTAPTTEPEYSISRVLATRVDPTRKQKRYWVRWAGYSAASDSWVTAAMAGSSERALDLWIRRTHRAYPPVVLEGPFVTPPDRVHQDVPVTAIDRDVLAAARSGKA